MLSDYVVKFVLFSFLGWIYECTYCAVKSKHWDNRGFLFGPICPIYGVGAGVAMVLFLDWEYFPGAQTPWWKIFLICAAGSAVLEYSVSFILEKCFHAMWWDYSEVPFNVNGRICLPATTGFGIAGVVMIKWVIPPICETLDYLDPYPVLVEFLALAFVFCLGMDLALTVASLTSLLKTMDEMEARFNEYMEESVERMVNAPAHMKEKMEESPAYLMDMAKRVTRRQRRHIHVVRRVRNQRYVDRWERLKNALNHEENTQN